MLQYLFFLCFLCLLICRHTRLGVRIVLLPYLWQVSPPVIISRASVPRKRLFVLRPILALWTLHFPLFSPYGLIHRCLPTTLMSNAEQGRLGPLSIAPFAINVAVNTPFGILVAHYFFMTAGLLIPQHCPRY